MEKSLALLLSVKPLPDSDKINQERTFPYNVYFVEVLKKKKEQQYDFTDCAYFVFPKFCKGLQNVLWMRDLQKIKSTQAIVFLI